MTTPDNRPHLSVQAIRYSGNLKDRKANEGNPEPFAHLWVTLIGLLSLPEARMRELRQVHPAGQVGGRV